MYFKAVLALPKTARSAQTHKSISFIWIVWSTLYVYLWSRLQTLQVATKNVKIHCTDGFRNDTKVERRRIYNGASINNVTIFFWIFDPPPPITFSQLSTVIFFINLWPKKVMSFMDSLVIHPVGLRVSANWTYVFTVSHFGSFQLNFNIGHGFRARYYFLGSFKNC